jgi:hypothetical protein
MHFCSLLFVSVFFSAPAGAAQTPALTRSARVVSDDVAPEVAGRVRALVERQDSFVAMARRGRVVFIGVELVRVKPAKVAATLTAEPQVVFRATHYRYADNVTVYSTVDLGRNSVIGVVEAKNVPTPLSVEELAEARELALSNPEVKGALGDRAGKVKVEALGLRSRDLDDPIFGHRAMVLLFRDGNRYLANFEVVVDLTAKTVTATQSRPGPAHEGMPR